MRGKKYAILSMQRIVNFGSVLQAYSLRQILREITDCQVTFLDIDNATVLPSKQTIRSSVDYDVPAAYPPGLLQRAKRWIFARCSKRNKHLIRKFMKKELGLSEKANADHYNCVVVGSDEVFNHSKGIRLQLHGDVKQADKVISYAASCGSAMLDDIAPENKERLREVMSRFSAISVRDETTENYVSTLYDGPVESHLDPVLVGDLCRRPHRSVKLKNYLLVYAYGQRIRSTEEINAIRAFAKTRGLKTVSMGGTQFWCDLYIPTSPFRLLDYFYHADYVVTDTFHGTIFSVINQKKFAVIVRKTNENKLGGLLRDLQLEHRRVGNINALAEILDAEIDYPAIGAILERERARTRQYLKTQLEG